MRDDGAEVNRIALRFPVAYLFASTLLEVLALPLHILVFAWNRRGIQRHIATLLAESARR